MPAIANATSYTWAYSGTGATISGTTAAITINFAANATAGSLTVMGTNACGNGTVSASYAITVNPLPAAAGVISGTPTVCQGQNGVAYSVPAIANATSYTWAYSGTGATISGTTAAITINFATNATAGNLTVVGTNACGNGIVSANYAITVNPLPAAAGAISGTPSVCQGQNGVAYSVPAIANSDANGYVWVYTGTGATIIGTTNSITIDFAANATSGNLTVMGTNACGNGTVSANYTITVNEAPTANAGADDDACGYSYTLNATPSVGIGTWTYTGPGTASFINENDPNTLVTVDLLGVYTFTWTEVNGGICSDADDVDINFYEVTIDSVVTAFPNCYGGDGTITIYALGGFGDLQYSIDDGFTWQPLNNVFSVPLGIYLVAVKDANDCIAYWPEPIVMEEPQQILVGATTYPVTGCYGDATGSIVINVYPGTLAEYEYSIYQTPTEAQWVESNIFPGLTAGQYYPKVRHILTQCVVENPGNPVTVGGPDPILFTTTPKNIDPTTCWDSLNGEIRVSNVSGGTGIKWVSIDDTDVWFKINNPASVYTFTGLGVGDHIIRVRDRNNNPSATPPPCEVTRVVTLTGPPPILITSVSLTHNQCWGDTNGEINATAIGGTGARTFSLWRNGLLELGPQATGLFTGLIADTYTIRVTDDNDCERDSIVEIESPDELVASMVVFNLLCPSSSNDGVIRASGTGGTLPYTVILYLDGVQLGLPLTISLPSATVDFTGLAAGNYKVGIQDANPTCSEAFSAEQTLFVPAPLAFNGDPTWDAIDCAGELTTVRVSATGGTTPYFFTLFNASGIQVGTTIEAPNTDPVEFINIPAGDGYYIALDDINGCGPENTFPFNIVEPEIIDFDVDVTGLSCFGDEVTVTVNNVTGGSGTGYQYSFNGGAFTNSNVYSFTPTEGGVNVDVTIVVKDDNECESIPVIEIIPVPAELTLTINPEDVHTVTCFDGDDGWFTALALNGTPPYEYTLETIGGLPVGIPQNGNAGETVTFSDLSTGDYILTVTDDKGCSDTRLVNIGQPNEVAVEITDFVSPTCDGDGNSTPGLIIAEASGGSGTFTYTLYQDGSLVGTQVNLTLPLVATFGDLSAGDYYVIAFDSNGCGPATSDTETLDNPTDIEFDQITYVPILCPGGVTVLTVTVNNPVGTPLYSVLPDFPVWQVSNEFTLAGGTYTVRAKDDNNCIITQGYSIIPPPAWNIGTIGTSPTTATDMDGKIEVTVIGGTPNYQLDLSIWNDVTSSWDFVTSVVDIISNHTFLNLGIGLYQITVTDANLCTTSVEVTLAQFTITLTGTDALCFGVCSGTITLTPIGGTIQTLTWTKDGIDFTAEMEANYNAIDNKYENICGGTYEATAMDTEGITSVRTVTIQQPQVGIEVNVLIASSPACYGDLGYVEFEILNGTPYPDGYDITWDGGSSRGFTANPLVDNDHTSYIFTITDANRCWKESDLIVFTPATPMVLGGIVPLDLTCHSGNGPANGKISVLVNGGAQPITYSITGPVFPNPGPNTSGIFNQLPAGTYTISAVDANGCTFDFGTNSPITLIQPDPIQIQIVDPSTIVPLTCWDDQGADVVMSYGGGNGGFTYRWLKWDAQEELNYLVQESENLIAPTPGYYTILVTDSKGCMASDMIPIPGPTKFRYNFNTQEAICKNSDDDQGEIKINYVFWDIIPTGTVVYTPGEPENMLTISWNHNANLNNIWSLTGLTSGNYSATITDVNGCTDDFGTTIEFPEINSYSLRVFKDDPICNNGTAFISANTIQNTWNYDLIDSIAWYSVTPVVEGEDILTLVNVGNTYSLNNVTSKLVHKVVAVSYAGCIEELYDTLRVYPRARPFVDPRQHPFFSADTSAFRDTTVISILADTEYDMLVETYLDSLSYFGIYPSEFFNPYTSYNAETEDDIGTRSFATKFRFNIGYFEPYLTGTMRNYNTGLNEKYIPIKILVLDTVTYCLDSLELKARVLNRIKIPNVFTPNGDGVNDVWIVPYGNLFPEIEIYVYNRWGYTIWEGKGSEAHKGWNGNNSRGTAYPTGTYYYVVKFNVGGNSGWKNLSGSITILR